MKRESKRQWKGYFRVQRPMSSRHGVYESTVYGVIENYCDMSKKVCTVSHQTIGEILNISRNTVITNIQLLIKHGYITDLTPDLRNHPHTYKLTGKLYKEAQSQPFSEPTVEREEEEPVSDERPEQEETEIVYDIIEDDNLHEIAAQEMVCTTDTPESLLLSSLAAVPNSSTACCSSDEQPAVHPVGMKKNIKELKKETSEENIPTPEGEEKKGPQNDLSRRQPPALVWNQFVDNNFNWLKGTIGKMEGWYPKGWKGWTLHVSIDVFVNQDFLKKSVQPKADLLLQEQTGCPEARFHFIDNYDIYKAYTAEEE